MGQGLHDPVTALLANGSDLIAATVRSSSSPDSSFLSPEAGVWRWNGRGWVEMTSRISGEIYCMAWYQGVLVVGGEIAFGPDRRFRCIAQWDGLAWQPLGEPLESAVGEGYPVSVVSVVQWNQTLAFAGSFGRLGNVATWDGQLVRFLRCDLVPVLAVWRGALLAGGWPSSDVLCIDGGRLLTWEEGRWTDFAGGIQVPPEGCPPYVHVSGLLVANDEVIVTGWFSRVGGVMVQNVVRYRNGSWEPMGVLDHGAFALLGFNGHLLAADPGSHSPAVRCWDGAQWTPIGPDLDGPVRCLAAHGDGVVAAGEFTGHVAWFPLSGLADAPNQRMHLPARFAVRR